MNGYLLFLFAMAFAFIHQLYIDHQLVQRFHAEFFPDRRVVLANSMHGHDQLFGDLVCRFPLCQPLKNITLGFRERGDFLLKSIEFLSDEYGRFLCPGPFGFNFWGIRARGALSLSYPGTLSVFAATDLRLRVLANRYAPIAQSAAAMGKMTTSGFRPFAPPAVSC